jgi:GNAT superfamily N-acetyltransferase
VAGLTMSKPPAWARLVRGRLTDGTPVAYRPVDPGDSDRLAEGFERLSPTSRYYRFFSGIGHLSPGTLRYLTDVDFRDHFAWVVGLEDEPLHPGIGIGRWIRRRDRADQAEIAMTVLDEYQRRGAGRGLLRVLAWSAARLGIGSFTMTVLAGNRHALELLYEAGATVTRLDSGCYDLLLPLSGPLSEPPADLA